MRHFLVILPLLSVCSSAFGQTLQIFREINIAPYGTVALGSKFSQRDSLAAEVLPSLYLLGPGFGGTEGIFVKLKDDDTVAALLFIYGPDYDYAGSRSDYVEMLGPQRGSTTDEAAQCDVWEDEATRFEMARVRSAGGFLAASMMADASPGDFDVACILLPIARRLAEIRDGVEPSDIRVGR